MPANYQNFNVQVTGKYVERPDLRSMVGMYLLDITLVPQSNAGQKVTGRQRVDVKKIGDLFPYAREKTGLAPDTLYGEVRKSSLADWDWTFSIDNFVNSLENATKYIQVVSDFLKEDNKVAGVAFDTRIRTSIDHWAGMMPVALNQMGSIALDDLLFFFLRF